MFKTRNHGTCCHTKSVEGLGLRLAYITRHDLIVVGIPESAESSAW